MNLFVSFWKGILDARSVGTTAAINALSGVLSPRQNCVAPPPIEPIIPQRNRPFTTTAPFSSAAGVAEGLAAVPQVMVRTFFDTLAMSPSLVVPCPTVCSAPSPISANTIVDEANRYLNCIPGEGALLDDLVDHVILKTRIDGATVRSVVLRNFSSNGRLVWRGKEKVTKGSVVSQMEAALKRLGYTDLRLDYRLTAIPERNDFAALIAFDAAGPAVLCYPVERNQVEDPLIREAALFQAGEVAPGQTAHYVWVSDGAVDFFYDFQASAVIGALPAIVAVPVPAL